MFFRFGSGKYWRKLKNWLLEILGMRARMKLEDYFLGRELELMHAWAEGDQRRAESLLRAGQAIDFYGRDGVTPLLWFIMKNDEDAFKLAVDMGADPNLGSPDGFFPLTALINQNNYKLVRFLLESGADPNIVNRNGEPALFVSILRGYWDLLKLLLEFGADVNKLSHAGQNSAIYAAYLNKFDMVYFLLENGADSVLTAKNGQTLKSLVEKKLRRETIAEGQEQFAWLVKVKQLLEK